MLTQISFGLTALLVLIVLYFLIRPEKILAKKPHLTAKNLRIRLGVALLLGIVALALKLPSLLENQEKDPKLATMEKFFRDRLTRYTDRDKTRPFTKSCIPFQINEVRKSYAQLSEEVLKLAAEDTCSCMAHYLGDLEEFGKVEEAIGQGKDYESSMNAFMDTSLMMEKAKPCME